MIAGHTEDGVNAVNAPGLAAERGIVVSETTRTSARDFTELVRVTVVAGGKPSRVVGTTLGRRNRPHLLEVWGRRFNLQLEDHMALFRYEDRPGIIGLVGTTFGTNGVNIDAAAVAGTLGADGGAGLGGGGRWGASAAWTGCTPGGAGGAATGRRASVTVGGPGRGGPGGGDSPRR